MSGIYNIGHYVMTWSISNCEQGSGTCLFYRHSTRMYLMEEKQGGPIPTGLKRWPLKLRSLRKEKNMMLRTTDR